MERQLRPGGSLLPEAQAHYAAAVEVDRLSQEVANKFAKLLAAYPTQWYRFRALEFVEDGV